MTHATYLHVVPVHTLHQPFNTISRPDPLFEHTHQMLYSDSLPVQCNICAVLSHAQVLG